MIEVETNRQTGQDHEDSLYPSLIHNKRLRGPDETFVDAMRQGEAAMDEKTRAMINDMLKKASRS